MSHVAISARIMFTKFGVVQPIHSWLTMFLLLILHVTLWPWPLTFWSWTFASHVFKHYTTFQRNRATRMSIVILKIWRRRPYWIWPEVDCNNSATSRSYNAPAR